MQLPNKTHAVRQHLDVDRVEMLCGRVYVGGTIVEKPTLHARCDACMKALAWEHGAHEGTRIVTIH